MRPSNQTLTILDYQDGVDKFSIKQGFDPGEPEFRPISGNPFVTFLDIQRLVVGTDTRLTFTDTTGTQQTIAVLAGFVDPNLIDATDFI